MMRIAIVGSYDPRRQKELGLKNLAIASQAGEDLGRELARQGFGIVVYSSLPHTLEIDIVRGYLSQSVSERRSIEVLYSQKNDQPIFEQQSGNEDKFSFVPDFNPDWEFSFYQSLATVDGMLIVGGGPSALIAGLVVIGHRKPLVACATFGGSGDKIWRALRAQNYAVTAEDLGSMAPSKWSPPELASKLVGMLHKQKEEFARLDQLRVENEEKRIQARRMLELRENSTINWHAIVSTLLFALAAFIWPLVDLIDASDPVQILSLVLMTPMIAGASGASIRVVLDWATGVTRTFAMSTYNQYILLRYAALGVVAGGLAGVSFVLAQIFANDATINSTVPLRKLVPFLVIIGFAAGLAAEVVLSNLRKTPPTVDIPGVKVTG